MGGKITYETYIEWLDERVRPSIDAEHCIGRSALRAHICARFGSNWMTIRSHLQALHLLHMIEEYSLSVWRISESAWSQMEQRRTARTVPEAIKC